MEKLNIYSSLKHRSLSLQTLLKEVEGHLLALLDSGKHKGYCRLKCEGSKPYYSLRIGRSPNILLDLELGSLRTVVFLELMVQKKKMLHFFNVVLIGSNVF